ncbi:hypothetical protein CIL05_06695 [Virgibacillus profundi]|uniref:Recombinase zinc beta ribbon domain-containing protein n=1 Tax=Virgibacillus profundi TaxID=2024555 RepID=A0A2A2IEJ2_9BACI|nr:zinc ribbon domain-containing protein [Virgibacillus profundi]PAV30149.1 hypothetical protein CIL05_06695 [Virgibacillus profundi]PXY54321.1 hypothetical protein CIT14_06780 [Virgibacillus profundi]
MKSEESVVALFSKKIKCAHCGGNFKSKMQRGKRIYLCSRYDARNGSCNKRVALFEQFLIDVINKRYEIKWGRVLDEDEMRDKVVEINVEEKNVFRIRLADFEEDIIYSENKYVF